MDQVWAGAVTLTTAGQLAVLQAQVAQLVTNG
jgi:hypothetical protein